MPSARRRTLRRETLLAGAFYLIALGGGVMIGSDVALVAVVIGSGLLGIAGASTKFAQSRIPGLGRLPLIEDQEFRVVPAKVLADQEAALASAADAHSSPEPTTFKDIKPLLEGHVDEGRAFWVELSERPSPERVGELYGQAADWQDRVVADLQPYHHGVATEFRQGGSILSPQLAEIRPTDCATLQVFVERRGQVLRNLLDGTPGKDLEWAFDFEI